MTALACPQCTSSIPDQGHCEECGLDASLLLQILNAAARLAWRAAQQAADGAWQEAYDSAAESLSLDRRENDLASFVLLAAALAGAQGTVKSIPRPRMEAVPAPLSALVERVLATATTLRDLTEGSATDADLEATLRELDDHHPWLRRTNPERGKPRTTWSILAAGTLSGLILASVVAWWAVNRVQARSQGRIDDLAAQLLRTDEFLRHERSRSGPASNASRPNVSPVAPASSSDHTASAIAAFHDDAGRRSWIKGFSASKHRRYEEARQFLELAVQGPHESDYWDDALYYLAKTYHRLGRREEALAGYQRLEREAPSSSYLPEARRLVARLERHLGVDR